MRTSKILLCIGVLAVLFTACQKETSEENGLVAPAPVDSTNNGGGGATNGTEQATWNFVSARIVSTLTVEGTYMGYSFKSIGSTDITSKNNAGTVAFDGKAMELQAVAFSLDGTMNTDIYANGIKTFAQSEPVSEDVPAFSELAEYKKIGSDSLYFPHGLEMGGALPAGAAVGAKLKWEGTKMTLTISTAESFADDYNGVPMSANAKNTLIVTLQKP